MGKPPEFRVLGGVVEHYVVGFFGGGEERKSCSGAGFWVKGGSVVVGGEGGGGFAWGGFACAGAIPGKFLVTPPLKTPQNQKKGE